MPYAELNGLKLYYEEFGRGDTVLFLHSHFSRGLLAFSGQILPFSGHYRCLFPDFRGHGRTICDDLTWNSRMVADDMALFLDKLGIEKAHLIGYSCGAYVGCYMASKYPDKVKSLVTIGGAAHARPEGASDMLPENLITLLLTGSSIPILLMTSGRKLFALPFLSMEKTTRLELLKSFRKKCLQQVSIKSWAAVTVRISSVNR